MTTPGGLASLVVELVRPGVLCAFVGAGGKTTAMRTAAAILSRRGLRVRMTTTTRVGREELAVYPVSFVQDGEGMRKACEDEEPVRLIVARESEAPGKYAGVHPGLLAGLPRDGESVLLVEADGSRRKPLKVPTDREPVIPPNSAVVCAFMGASGFDEPIDEEHCYNHDAAFAILGSAAVCFDARSIAALAAHPAGCRKGVAPGMAFHVLLNQGDLAEKRATGIEALAILGAVHGIQGSLVSLQQGVVYETTAN